MLHAWQLGLELIIQYAGKNHFSGLDHFCEWTHCIT